MSSYKSGALILRIGQSDIPQEWDMREATRSFMNDAFKLYFNGKKVIEEVDFDTGLAMQRALFEASSNGFGIGGNKGDSWFEPDDLIEAIEYLDTRGGRRPWWGHTDREVVSGGLYAPKAFANFMENVEKQAHTFFRGMQDLSRHANAVSENDDLAVLSQKVNLIDTAVKNIRRYLWLAPRSINTPLTKRIAGGTLKITDLFDKVHSGGSIIADLRTGKGEEAAFNAIGVVVSTLPIMGEFYGAAINSVPALKSKLQHIVNTRTKQLDLAANGRDYRKW